jgi:hypothetical protein
VVPTVVLEPLGVAGIFQRELQLLFPGAPLRRQPHPEAVQAFWNRLRRQLAVERALDAVCLELLLGAL